MGRGRGSLNQLDSDVLRSGFTEELLPDQKELARRGALKRITALTEDISKFRKANSLGNWIDVLTRAPLEDHAMQQLLTQEPIVDETKRFLEEIILFSLPSNSSPDFRSYLEEAARKIGLNFVSKPLSDEEVSALSLSMVLELQKNIRHDYNWNSLGGLEQTLPAGKINANLSDCQSVSDIALLPLAQALAEKISSLPKKEMLKDLFEMNDSSLLLPIVAIECRALLSSLKEALDSAYGKESNYPDLDPTRIVPSILDALQEKGALARPVFVTALMSWNWPEAIKIYKPSGPYSDRIREVINKHMQPSQRIRKVLNIDSEPPAHYFPLDANESLEQKMSKILSERRRKLLGG